jgi:hypothetical protein
MALETGSFVNDLTPANPPNSDPAGQGDDHLRLIKSTVQATFPQMGSILGQVRRQDTAVSISSTWNTNHFMCSASATTTVVLTLPPAASITTGFYVDLTAIGTGTISVLPSGAASINGAASLAIPRLYTARLYYGGSSAWFSDVYPASVAAPLLGGSLTVAGTTTLSGTVVLSNGQLMFPATQNPSADANTLDDYEEGTWTPAITFATPGNLVVAYSTRLGLYTKIGQLVYTQCSMVTSTFTHTTASGIFEVTGLPFVPATITGAIYPGSLGFIAGENAPGAENMLTTRTQSGQSFMVIDAVNISTGGTSVLSTPNFLTAGIKTINLSVTYPTAT